MKAMPLARLQSRITSGTSLILAGVRDVKSLKRAIRSRLAGAFRDGVLTKDCTNLVWHEEKLVVLPGGRRERVIAVVGGIEINRDRDPTLPHFPRSDGAWFDFHIDLRAHEGEHPEHRGDLELLGYGYELRFPPDLGSGVDWLRFDLNHPAHDNELRSVRAHFHPGDEDLQAPSPVLHPEEAGELLLSDLLRLPDKRRRAVASPS